MEGIINTAFRAFLSNTTDMIFVKDINLIYVACSTSFVDMVGMKSVDDIVGKSDFDIFADRDLAKRYTDDDHKLLAAGKDIVNYVEPLTDDNGRARYSNTSKYILKNADGDAVGILGISRDITREYLARRRHLQELQYLFELPEDTFAALFMDIDDWRIIRHQRHTQGDNVIPVCETMDDFKQTAIRCLEEDGDAETLEFYRSLSRESMKALSDSGARAHELEYLRRMPNGEKLWVHVEINFMVDPENGHLCAIWCLRNIDMEKQETINLQRAAERDEMTGLLNRASTIKFIEKTLKEHGGARHALFIVDVDNFKAINDTLGHQTGDTFLIALARSLKNCFRESDIVGRMGGDEFFLLMKNVPNDMVVAEKAQTLLSICYMLCESYPGLNLSISIGVSLFPEDGKNLTELYAKADEALYQAKNRGKNQCVFASLSIG